MPVFYHVADLHIGNTFSNVPKNIREKLEEGQLKSLQRALKKIKEDNPCGLLIAGDLFDSNLISRDLVARVQMVLKEAGIPIYILPGSGDVTDRSPHDALIEPSVYGKDLGWAEISNVKIFRNTKEGEFFLSEDCPTAIYGKAVIRKGESPLPEIPLEDVRYHIVMLHGDASEMAYIKKPDYPISLREVREKGFNYAALGHWHSFKTYPREISGADFLAVYPGPLQDLSFTHNSGKLVKVILGEKVSIEAIRVSEYPFVVLEISAFESPSKTVEEILREINEPGKTLLRLYLKGTISPENRRHYVSEIEENLEPLVFYLEKIHDKMTLKISEELVRKVGEKTVLGNLLKRFNGLKGNASAEEKEVIELALEYGFGLLKGNLASSDLELSHVLKENFHEDY